MTRSFVIVVLLTLGLAGCGSSASKQAGPPPPTGVYISASDCADSEKLGLADCSVLIDRAIALHYQTAKTYISRRLCEATEGANHCERSEDNQFRPQLQAFLVTFSNPPQAEGLYAQTEVAEAGFQTKAKKKIMAIDETVMFSKSARVVAASNGT